jgi:ATP-binding cassette subfamily C (CFTR/MRP) protein 4
MSEIEEDGGNIVIDQRNTRQLGLKMLRDKISIIPQVPFVFTGTIRRNLDPLDLYPDE